ELFFVVSTPIIDLLSTTFPNENLVKAQKFRESSHHPFFSHEQKRKSFKRSFAISKS
ncbi:hypothetical protein J1N35_007937, partial [Gossypium stocksii]